ncbi:helix-turn-helix domain-containing protein [Deinococcus pimensis]|uniref:helix-turn-helix domain-containing protein n=1 Tax=Deinococcus pimensis TaxID=309888 RepID=UPI0004B3C709|nr:helix-turn-helix domain-containing protein [Deinococcus pimensis]
MPVRVRPVTDDELEALTRLARARKAAAGKVRRAQIILASHGGHSVKVICEQLHANDNTVCFWIHRFNRLGLPGLEEGLRSGRPPTYTPEEMSIAISTALTPPEQLDLPFHSWTLDRLVAYLNDVKGIGIRRSRVSEVFRREGLRWHQEETWFGERVDPDFAKKRGPSSGSTLRRPNTAS